MAKALSKREDAAITCTEKGRRSGDIAWFIFIAYHKTANPL